MTLENIKAWIATVVKSPVIYGGRIDSSKDNCIGIFNIQGPKPTMAVGGLVNKGYGIKAVSFLIHWGKDSNAAELKAQEVYDALYGHGRIYLGQVQYGEAQYGATDIVIGGDRVIMFDMRQSGPVSIDTDENGIFEYVVQTNIYYEI